MKNRLIQWYYTLSSGRWAAIVGSPKYAVIDRASSTVILHVAKMTEEECAQVIESADYDGLAKRILGRA